MNTHFRQYNNGYIVVPLNITILFITKVNPTMEEQIEFIALEW